jgi:hypothetical protein
LWNEYHKLALTGSAVSWNKGRMKSFEFCHKSLKAAPDKGKKNFWLWGICHCGVIFLPANKGVFFPV